MRDPARARSWDEVLPSLAAGLITGLLSVVYCSSVAALIFSGPLTEHLSLGIATALFCSCAVGVAASLSSSYPGTIANIQTEPAAILALMATVVAGAMPSGATPDETLGTVLAAIVLASIVTGTLLVVLGYFRLGALVRFIPYPVIGGFMAGIGWLLVTGGLTVMTDLPVSLHNLHALLETQQLARWIPGLLVGLSMLVAQRSIPNPLAMPAIILISVATFYGILLLTGTSLAAARADGWLPGELPNTTITELSSLTVLVNADWGIVIRQLGSIGAIALITLVALLLNASALELAADEDIDLDRELRLTGAANLVAALGGGMIGYHSLSLSTLAVRMGVRTRLVGLVTAIVSAIVLVAGTSIVGVFPKPVLGGLLMFPGLSFLVQWIHDARARLPRGDYAVVLLILLTVGSVGYLQGLGIGIAAAVILFVVKYSRISLVKQAVSGTLQQSNVDRPREHLHHLREHGECIYILKLQGFIFFGSGNNLLNRIRARATDGTRPPLRFVIFDFRRVTGLDTSAAMSFMKIRQLADRMNFMLIFTAPPPELREQLGSWGFTEATQAAASAPLRLGLRWFDDLDHGLEWCEDQLLAAVTPGGATPAPDDRWDLGFPIDLRDRLHPYLEEMTVARGEELIHQGEKSDELYFIEAGQFSIRLAVAGGKTIRLRKIGPGTVLGELGLYLSETRSASVTADEMSTVLRLRASALERMQRTEPDLASAFHEFMARLLAERLLHTNKLLEAVLD